MTTLILFAATATLFFFLLLLVLLPQLTAPSPEARRVLTLIKSDREDRRRIRWRERLGNLFQGAATRLRRGLHLGEDAKLRRRMHLAGLRAVTSADTFFAAQALGVLVLGMVGSLVPVNTPFWIFTGAIVGFMAPDVWLTSMGKRRQARMRRGIPDTIDLMCICVDAGLGLDQALLRVRDALSVSHPDLNQEFDRLTYELQAGTPRPEAWRRLAERTRLEELASFASILTETDRFGTPIVKALAGFAKELRLKRRQHAEEAAAKTKIKIIFPLVLCIFPCIFIVLLAPALLNIADGFKTFGN